MSIQALVIGKAGKSSMNLTYARESPVTSTRLARSTRFIYTTGLKPTTMAGFLSTTIFRSDEWGVSSRIRLMATQDARIRAGYVQDRVEELRSKLADSQTMGVTE